MTRIGDQVEEMDRARLKLGEAQRVVVLTGAGISADSGVPTFRAGGSAITWKGLPFDVVSSREMVERDLPLVWEWFDYRRGVISRCDPNRGHTALADAEKSGRYGNFTLVTQNIDGLHRAAGSAGVIELHGNINEARCRGCGELLDLLAIPAEERPPVCPECSDTMRPNVILFGEALDEDALLEAYGLAAECDVCLVVGTSAVVYPANMIPRIAKREGAFLIEVNPEETELTPLSDISIRGSAATVLPEIFKVSL